MVSAVMQSVSGSRLAIASPSRAALLIYGSQSAEDEARWFVYVVQGRLIKSRFNSYLQCSDLKRRLVTPPCLSPMTALRGEALAGIVTSQIIVLLAMIALSWYSSLRPPS